MHTPSKYAYGANTDKFLTPNSSFLISAQRDKQQFIYVVVFTKWEKCGILTDSLFPGGFPHDLT